MYSTYNIAIDDVDVDDVIYIVSHFSHCMVISYMYIVFYTADACRRYFKRSAKRSKSFSEDKENAVPGQDPMLKPVSNTAREQTDVSFSTDIV